MPGTGQPLHFRCSKCRWRSPHGSEALCFLNLLTGLGYVHSVELTGRERAINDGNARGRSDNMRREYRCNDCGHIGWSRHIDLKRKMDRMIAECDESGERVRQRCAMCGIWIDTCEICEKCARKYPKRYGPLAKNRNDAIMPRKQW